MGCDLGRRDRTARCISFRRASYALTPAFRIVAAQEFTDGPQRNTSTTRLGFSAAPWKDALLTTTLNQSQISEYGPRTFALFALNQRFLLAKRWGLDLAVDSSHTFSDTGVGPLVGTLLLGGAVAVGLLFGGRLLLPSLFAQAARTKNPEVFLAASVLVVRSEA